MTPHEMDDALYERLVACTNRGNERFDEDDYEGALAEFRAALELIPKPVEDWEAATWVLASIGDALFYLDRYPEAHEALAHAVACPGGLGTAFIHLRLGQVQFELGNTDRAKDELARAYMAGGPEIFAQEDPKYITFLRRFMRGI
ncbi:MAG TPA: tetratricopeptide repeat protein [Thermoanaerobaculia bacterium]|nr:tetratricopeptide repeat protein [Thermoanaerobaculia bacterium]